MMKKPVIDINKLSLSIADKPILKSISLQIYQGDYLSIIGPNGAGKTSLLKCLMRIYPSPPGSIRISGKPLEKYSQKNLARLLSYVPQSDGRIFPFTVEEFVMMGRYPYLSPFTSFQPEDKKVVRDVIELTGISHMVNRQLNTLSGGERQTAFIAAALAQGSDILLLDEPTTFLDPRHEQEIYKILRKINQQLHMTIISVTHDINSAVLQSSRIIILKNGELIFDDDAPKIMSNEILGPAYDKTFTFSQHPLTGKKIIVPEAPEA